MKSFIKYLRKAGVLVVGLALLIIGIILIPLPGPGLLICFAALFVLSLEFDSAKPYRERMQTEIKKIIATAKDRQDTINSKVETKPPKNNKKLDK